jgi:hypothetical protein
MKKINFLSTVFYVLLLMAIPVKGFTQCVPPTITSAGHLYDNTSAPVQIVWNTEASATQGYIINIVAKNGAPDASGTNTFVPGGGSQNFSNYINAPYAQYDVRIKSVCGTEIGDTSEWSASFPLTVGTKPVCNATTITAADYLGGVGSPFKISWTDNGATNGYIINVVVKNGNPDASGTNFAFGAGISYNNFPPTTPFVNVTYAQYDVRIKSICGTEIGDTSEWSSVFPITIGTPPVCNAPANIGVQTNKVDTIRIRFSATADNVTLEYLPYEENFGTYQGKVMVLGITGTMYDITGDMFNALESGKMYKLRMRSNCNETSSNWSDSVIFVKGCVNVLGLAVNTVAEDSAVIKFMTPVMGSQYIYNITKAGVAFNNANEVTEPVMSVNNTITINSLDKDTRYIFRIKTNCVLSGSETAWDSLEFYTLGDVTGCGEPRPAWINIPPLTENTKVRITFDLQQALAVGATMITIQYAKQGEDFGANTAYVYGLTKYDTTIEIFEEGNYNFRVRFKCSDNVESRWTYFHETIFVPGGDAPFVCSPVSASIIDRVMDVIVGVLDNETVARNDYFFHYTLVSDNDFSAGDTVYFSATNQNDNIIRKSELAPGLYKSRIMAICPNGEASEWTVSPYPSDFEVVNVDNPCETAPAGLKLFDTPTKTDAVIEWEQIETTGIRYVINWAPEGTSLDNGEFDTTADVSSSYAINSLSHQTTYFVRIRTLCQNNTIASNWSDTIQFTTAFDVLNEDINLAEISIYPNPSNGTFIIKSADKAKVEIFSVNGVLVKSLNITGTSEVILDKKGTYLLRLTKEDGKSSTKQVIIK